MSVTTPGTPKDADSAGRLLVLSLHFAPEITGNAPLVTNLSVELAKRGYEIEVLCGTPHYRLPQVPEKYRGRFCVREEVAGVRITRCFAVPGDGSMAAKALNYGTFLLTSLAAALVMRRAQYVLVVSPPFLLGATGALLRFLRGSRFIYNAQDLFPEAYIRGGLGVPGFASRLMMAAQRWIYRRADAVTVITPSFRARIASRGIAEGKIHVIPNFADVEAIRPLPRENRFSQEHGLSEKFVVLYAGTIGVVHGAEMLVPVAQRFEDIPEMHLLVVGDGAKKKAVVEATQRAQLKNLRFLPPQPTNVLARMLASADVGLVLTRPGVGQSSFPSRIYSLMAAERPIVAALDLDSDAAELIRESGCGLVVTPGRPDELAEAILKLRSEPELRRQMGQNGRRYVVGRFTKQRAAEQYSELLRQLANSPRQRRR